MIQNITQPEQSLEKTQPDLCREWDYEKNFPKMPKAFSSGSGEMIWWLCKKNAEHSWRAQILSRVKANKGKGSGCPFCRGILR